jgi:hypothetical protein
VAFDRFVFYRGFERVSWVVVNSVLKLSGVWKSPEWIAKSKRFSNDYGSLVGSGTPKGTGYPRFSIPTKVTTLDFVQHHFA